jgi:hypothetical protein
VQTVEYSVNSVAAAAGANYCDLAAASTDDIYLRELHFFTAAATASSVALFRTTGAGVIWTWYDGLGLRIPASGSITLNNFGASAGSILAVTYVWRE